MKPIQKSVCFVSLGCVKNRVDTEIMAGMVIAEGARIVAEPEDADIVVINTCAFIEKAREESVETILEIANRVSEETILVAAGCMAQRYVDALSKEMPELKFFVGTKNLEAIKEILRNSKKRIHVSEAGSYLQTADTPRFLEPGSVSAYIKISDGCNRKCAFCSIPAIRGKARSRSIVDIVEEAKLLAKSGIVEINLAAQDTGAYGRDRTDGADLPTLLRALNDVSGIRWIRMLYLYPDSVDNELLYTMSSLEKVVPYLDIPIQHKSAKMLKIMKRGHSSNAIDLLIKRIETKLPNAFLRTTILVGHPGETEDDFEELVAFLKNTKFHHLGVFRYSSEEGTSAFNAPEQVSSKISYNRSRKIMSVQKQIVRKQNKALLGREIEVLVEGVADEDGYVLTGRHKGQAKEIDGITYLVSSSAKLGDIVTAKVIKTGDYDLVAEVVDNC